MSTGKEFSVDTSDFLRDANKLVELSKKSLLSIFNKSLSKASTQTVVKEARRDLKAFLSFSEDSTGETARSLGVKSAKRKPLVLLGGRSGKYNSQLVHILDSGTSDRSTKKGANRGRVLGLQFFANAMDAKGGDLAAKYEQYLKETYEKEVVKKVRK